VEEFNPMLLTSRERISRSPEGLRIFAQILDDVVSNNEILISSSGERPNLIRLFFSQLEDDQHSPIVNRAESSLGIVDCLFPAHGKKRNTS